MWNRIKTADRATLAIAGAALAIVLFLAVNLVVSLGLGNARVDLTENKIYTVSQSTRDVLAELTEPVTLKLYMSSSMIEEASSLRVYSDRVRQLLKSYEQLAGGKLRVEQIDPIPFSSAEDEAIGYSLAAFNLSRAGEQGYFGVVGTNTVDGVETIPALTPARENYLEYDLTRLIARLAHPTVPKVGIIDGLDLMGDPVTQRRPAAVISRIAKDYELVPVYPDATAIPDGLSALIVIHPFNLTPSTLYAIDQFAIRGGGVLAFLDTIAEHDARSSKTPCCHQPRVSSKRMRRKRASSGAASIAPGASPRTATAAASIWGRESTETCSIEGQGIVKSFMPQGRTNTASSRSVRSTWGLASGPSKAGWPPT